MDDSTPTAAHGSTGVSGAAGAAGAEGTSRFELAPPRRFMLPAILLLLSERPGYGYGLVPRLREFRLGHVDRPAVYRALSQLERDQLVESSSQHRTAGQSRRVYGITARGERVLRAWMGIVKEAHRLPGRSAAALPGHGNHRFRASPEWKEAGRLRWASVVRRCPPAWAAGAGWLRCRHPWTASRLGPHRHSPRARPRRRDGSGWCRIDRWY